MDPVVSVVNLDEEISSTSDTVYQREPTPNLLTAGPMGGDFDTTNLTSGRSSGVCSSPPESSVPPDVQGDQGVPAGAVDRRQSDQLIRDVINQLERQCSTSTEDLIPKEVSIEVGQLPLASSLFANVVSTSPVAAVFEKGVSPIGDSVEKHKSAAVYSSGAYSTWIASAKTRETLGLLPPSADGRICYTMPGIMIEDSLGDPVMDALRKHCVDDPTQLSYRRAHRSATGQVSIPSLLELVAAGDFRAAIDVTGKLLKTFGQGMGKAHQPSRNTEESLKIWSIRFYLLVATGQNNLAASEMEAFGNLDAPDLYFEYYPETYRGRKGSMVPFSMRLLHAELPKLTGQHQESLVRLNRILAVIRQIIKNINISTELSTEDREAALALWRRRQKKAMHALARTLLAVKDFRLASTVYGYLTVDEDKPTLSLSGRVQLTLGNLNAARMEFQKYQASGDDAKSKSLVAMHNGYIQVFNNTCNDALVEFQRAAQLEPTNVHAINNAAVCLLYLGRLDDAVSTLENAVNQNPTAALQEGICTNLCTLYELESSRSTQKKASTLRLVNQYKGDGFNLASLKLPV